MTRGLHPDRILRFRPGIAAVLALHIHRVPRVEPVAGELPALRAFLRVGCDGGHLGSRPHRGTEDKPEPPGPISFLQIGEPDEIMGNAGGTAGTAVSQTVEAPWITVATR